jgi:hypothetical protein
VHQTGLEQGRPQLREIEGLKTVSLKPRISVVNKEFPKRRNEQLVMLLRKWPSGGAFTMELMTRILTIKE